MFTLSIFLPCVVGNKNLISCRIWTKPREKGERWGWEGERKAMNIAIIASEMSWCFLLQCFYLRTLIQVNHQIKYLIVLIFIRQIKRPIWCKFPYFINVTQTRTVRNFNRTIFLVMYLFRSMHQWHFYDLPSPNCYKSWQQWCLIRIYLYFND